MQETQGFDPWPRKIMAWQPTPVFLPGKSHGQRSLEGYSSEGCKESDMTEDLARMHGTEQRLWRTTFTNRCCLFPHPFSPAPSRMTCSSSKNLLWTELSYSYFFLFCFSLEHQFWSELVVWNEADPFIYFLFFIFSWNIIDLQYQIRFRWTVQRFDIFVCRIMITI